MNLDWTSTSSDASDTHLFVLAISLSICLIAYMIILFKSIRQLDYKEIVFCFSTVCDYLESINGVAVIEATGDLRSIKNRLLQFIEKLQAKKYLDEDDCCEYDQIKASLSDWKKQHCLSLPDNFKNGLRLINLD